jgi:hypothetical protein
MAREHGVINREVFGSDISVRNLDAIVANLRAYDKEVQGKFRDLAERYAVKTYHLIQRKLPHGPSAEHPYSTGFRGETLRIEWTPSGLVFDIGWWREDFGDEPSGRGIFYPPYPEFGTQDQEAQPVLQPAFDEIAPAYSTEISSLLRRTTRRYSAS